MRTQARTRRWSVAPFEARFGVVVLAMATTSLIAGCAGITQIAQLVQPPRFERDSRPAEFRLVGPTPSQPAGGAGVTIWLRVTNPNSFGFTLSTLSTTLLLEDTRAASGELPLGLPLTAGETSVIPVDLSISFADVPALAGALRQTAVGGAVTYQLDGTVGIEVARLSTPTFGPMRLAEGEVRIPALGR